LPFKLNQDRRHHIPRQRRKVTDWPAYEASLRQRGSLTVWFTEEAVAAWAAAPRTTRGGQPWYSPLTILTALTLRLVLRLAYRQAEGPIRSAVPRRLNSTDVGGSAQRLRLLVDSTGLTLGLLLLLGWPAALTEPITKRGQGRCLPVS
jgi:Transposase DDE domain